LAAAQQTLTIPYQALVRDASGNPLPNKQIGAEISLLQDSLTAVPFFTEIHNTTTNQFGQMDLQIGSVETAVFDSIDWSVGKMFIRLEVDITGGTDYKEIATLPLLAVPFAKYAENAKYTEDAAGWKMNETGISFMDGNVGIGKTNPEVQLDVEGNIKIDGNVDSFGGIFQDDSVNFTLGSTSGIRPRIYLHGINSPTYPGKIYMAAPDNIALMNNVGIGTLNPYHSLQVGDADGRYALFTSSSGIAYKGGVLLSNSIQGISYRWKLSPSFNSSQNGSVLKLSLVNASDLETDLIIPLFFQGNGNVGIGTSAPSRNLHVKDVMRLEPRSSAPSSPAKGDLYFDSSLNKLRVYDGTAWRNLH